MVNQCNQGRIAYSVSQKKSPLQFSEFFPKHTYYTILSTLDYKFLFRYLQL